MLSGIHLAFIQDFSQRVAIVQNVIYMGGNPHLSGLCPYTVFVQLIGNSFWGLYFGKT